MGLYTGIAQDNVTINSGTINATNLSVANNLKSTAPVIKTAAFTLAATENYVVCNGSASITVTLPTASANTGRAVTIKTIAAYAVVSASSNVKPIDSNTAGTAIVSNTAGKWATLVCDGTNWVVMAAG
jgi:hypothetical protein